MITDENSNKILIVTLATTTNFLPQAELLDYTIRHRFKSKFNVKIMVTQNLNIENYIWKFNSDVDIVPYIKFNGSEKDYAKRGSYYRDTINKFWMLMYDDYEYVVFIDADSFPLRNFDLDIEECIKNFGDKEFIGSTRFNGQFIAPESKYDFKVTDVLNGGFFILKPNRKLCLDIMMKYKNVFGNDETILTDIYKECVSYDMHVKLLDILLNVFFHDGGSVKLMNLFPQRSIDLALCDDEMYYLIFNNWKSYSLSHKFKEIKPLE